MLARLKVCHLSALVATVFADAWYIMVMFGFRSTWTSKEGPVKDIYNISDNPQYRLELKNPGSSPVAVWILLTRHITDKVTSVSALCYTNQILYLFNHCEMLLAVTSCPDLGRCTARHSSYWTRLSIVFYWYKKMAV